MSKKIENHCVSCGQPCLGNACVYRNVPVFYCDNCENEGAKYRYNGEDLCENCVKTFIKDEFDELSITEQAELLNMRLYKIMA